MADPRGGSAAAAGEGRVARTSGRRARGGDILTVTDIVIIIGIILWSGSLLNIHICIIFKEQSSDRSNAEIKMVSKNETRDDKYFIVGISILGTGNI